MTRDSGALKGKLVLVTGAAVGIGRGIALELARQGADVALHSIGGDEDVEEVAQQVASLGRRCTTIIGDLGRLDDCRRVVDEAAAYLGGLDALVNNAGVTVTIPFEQVTGEQFDRIYSINIRGQFFCAQHALPHISARGRALATESPRPWAGGAVVNISSVHAFAGFIGHAIYAGTKGAINAFTRELAIELCQRHVRVNAIAPGPIETPSAWKRSPDYTRELGNTLVPWGRIGLPADIAQAAAFLISDAAELITGHVLVVDGGLTAKMAIPQ